MIRTTFQSVNRHTQSVIQGRYSDLAALQQKLATGKQLTRPSDGAIETANVLRLKTQNSQMKQHEANINDGLAWLSFTETNMSSMGSIFDRMKELAIQGNNDTLSPTEREFIVREVEQLTRQMVMIVNQRYKGDYIFSGAHTDKPAVLLKEANNNQLARTSREMAFFDGTNSPAQIEFPNGIRADKIIPGSLEIATPCVKRST